jgi:RND family efflux transporter MFP subunit
MKKRISKFLRPITGRFTSLRRKTFVFIDRRPLTSFFITLALVLALIILGNLLNKPQPAQNIAPVVVKTVQVYTLEENPTIHLQAQVEKSGVITISSLSSGVVSRLYVKEGTYVRRGKTLAYISTNYQGGSVTGLQSSIAEKQLADLEANLADRKDLNLKTKTLAEATSYAANGDLQKQIAVRNSELADRSLDLQLEIQKIQTQITKVTASMSYPSSPFSGTIQRVLVKQGQVVSPGTPLMIIAQDVKDDPIIALAYAPREVVESVSVLEPATIHLPDMTFETAPSFITSDAISGNLYGIYFPIPDNYNSQTTEKGYLQVDIPLLSSNKFGKTSQFIPLDAIFQTREKAYVFVVDGDVATTRDVVLGKVQGSYVEVIEGLEVGTKVILNRNIVQGDKVKIQ